MVSVFLADDHAIVRDAIRRLLADDTRIQVVVEACDFSGAVTDARKSKPDVLILDLHMPLEPKLSLWELRVELKSCGAGILGMSFANDDDTRSLSAQMGASELLDKTQLSKVLIPSILRIASERDCFPPTVFAKPSYRSGHDELERPLQRCTGRN